MNRKVRMSIGVTEVVMIIGTLLALAALTCMCIAGVCIHTAIQYGERIGYLSAQTRFWQDRSYVWSGRSFPLLVGALASMFIARVAMLRDKHAAHTTN